jgi:hypothetical protein
MASGGMFLLFLSRFASFDGRDESVRCDFADGWMDGLVITVGSLCALVDHQSRFQIAEASGSG